MCVCVWGGGVRVWCICECVSERVCVGVRVCEGWRVCVCVCMCMCGGGGGGVPVCGACVWTRVWCECVYVSVCGRVCVGA